MPLADVGTTCDSRAHTCTTRAAVVRARRVGLESQLKAESDLSMTLVGEWAAAVLTSPMEHRGSQLLHPQRTDLRTNVHSLLHLSPFSDSHDGRRRTEKLAMDHSQCTLTLSVTFEGKDASPVPSSLHCLRCPATPAKRTRASVLC